MKDSGNLSAVSNELEAVKKDFTEVEVIVKGHLNGTSRSSAKDQTERLREEAFKREEELSRIEQEIERTYAECERQLVKNFCSEKPPKEPDQGTEKLLQVNNAAENENWKGNRKDLKIPR